MATGLGPQVFYAKGQGGCWYSEQLGQGRVPPPFPTSFICAPSPSALLFLPFEQPKQAGCWGATGCCTMALPILPPEPHS